MKHAIIFCAGAKGRKAFSYLAEKDYQVEAYVDNNQALTGTAVNGVPVYQPDYILEHPAYDIVVAMNIPAEIVQQLERMGVPNQIFLYTDAFEPCEELIEVKDFDFTKSWMELTFRQSPSYKKGLDEYMELDQELFCRMLSIIQKVVPQYVNREPEILEIGCGAGQFAQLLFRNGYRKYTGIDLAESGIELAKAHNIEHQERFAVGDGTDFLKNAAYDLVVMMEVLEHIKDDGKVFEAIKTGKLCCCSLPNFTSFNHYRTFDDLKSIEAHYGKYIDVLHYEEQMFSGGGGDKNKYLLFLGRKK